MFQNRRSRLTSRLKRRYHPAASVNNLPPTTREGFARERHRKLRHLCPYPSIADGATKSRSRRVKGISLDPKAFLHPVSEDVAHEDLILDVPHSQALKVGGPLQANPPSQITPPQNLNLDLVGPLIEARPSPTSQELFSPLHATPKIGPPLDQKINGPQKAHLDHQDLKSLPPSLDGPYKSHLNSIPPLSPLLTTHTLDHNEAHENVNPLLMKAYPLPELGLL
ncbi:hypothetical protein AXF42_Ash019314 [Apostasia shenzhenica]|uniref:Uncharacterized protein n=1 Tax=Apostasia shenzhenica TaxID=1088818 RepID=A0A2I0ARB8_9ASPA|nr:hypothetical protein AXF42_Ash019314 [Apostasia shenzhenica]